MLKLIFLVLASTFITSTAKPIELLSDKSLTSIENFTADLAQNAVKFVRDVFEYAAQVSDRTGKAFGPILDGIGKATVRNLNAFAYAVDPKFGQAVNNTSTFLGNTIKAAGDILAKAKTIYWLQ